MNIVWVKVEAIHEPEHNSSTCGGWFLRSCVVFLERSSEHLSHDNAARPGLNAVLSMMTSVKGHSHGVWNTVGAQCVALHLECVGEDLCWRPRVFSRWK